MKKPQMTARTLLLFLLFAAQLACFPALSIAADAIKAEDINTLLERSSLSTEAKMKLESKIRITMTAGIDPGDIVAIVERGLSRGADERILEEFLNIAGETQGRKLPTAPVLDRIVQGLAKGIPPRRILDAARSLTDKLAAARSLVNGVENSGLSAESSLERQNAITTVARALERSIPGETMNETASRIKAQDASLPLFDRALDTMTAFVENGMTREKAADLVHKALDKGYKEQDLAGMIKELSKDLRKGGRIEDTAERMESAIERSSVGSSYRGMENGRMPGSGPASGGRSGPGPGGRIPRR